MGLDIKYYSGLKKIEGGFDPDSDDVYEPNFNSDFPGRELGLEDAAYRYETEKRFPVGPYSYYGRWRNSLAKLAGYPASTDPDKKYPYSCGAWEASSGPFWELIMFSDCEGVIGPIVSAKLAKDFEDFAPKAREFDGDFVDIYNAFELAFETAAKNGAVRFY